tara:strand:- start:10 stop:951 length:942 start_codon:yes stop_codon:yes gene_type:complete
LRPDPSLRQVGFQEADIVGMAKPVTKYAKMITDPNSIRYELEKALFVAQDKRPGPVLLDIPLNIQKMDIDVDSQIGFDPKIEQSHFDLDQVSRQIDSYLEDLKKAERPVIMVGMGVRIADAVDELLELGRCLKIPCFPTWNALDVVTSDYEYYGGRIGTYGGSGRNFGIQNADLLLAVGSRISGRITGGNIHTFAREAKKYVVDVDQSLLHRKLQQVPFDENIFCDAKVFLQLLLKRVKGDSDVPDFQSWSNKVFDWKCKYDPVRPEFFEEDAIHPYAFVRRLSELMSSDDVMVGDCGGNIVTDVPMNKWTVN